MFVFILVWDLIAKRRLLYYILIAHIFRDFSTTTAYSQCQKVRKYFHLLAFCIILFVDLKKTFEMEGTKSHRHIDIRPGRCQTTCPCYYLNRLGLGRGFRKWCFFKNPATPFGAKMTEIVFFLHFLCGIPPRGLPRGC